MSEPKISEVLMLVKDKIIDGWVPRIPIRDHEICALRAMTQACSESSLEFKTAYRTVFDLVTEAVGAEGQTASNRGFSIMRWSDSGPKQKVIDGFDAAIRLAKEREQS